MSSKISEFEILHADQDPEERFNPDKEFDPGKFADLLKKIIFRPDKILPANELFTSIGVLDKVEASSIHFYPSKKKSMTCHRTAVFVSLYPLVCKGRRNPKGHLSFAEALDALLNHANNSKCKFPQTKRYVIYTTHWNKAEYFRVKPEIIKLLQKEAEVMIFLLTDAHVKPILIDIY